MWAINEGSSALNKLKPGDDVLSIEGPGTFLPNPSTPKAKDALAKAGDKKATVTFNVLSIGDTTPHLVKDLAVDYHLPSSGGKYGLGILLGLDDQHLVVSETLADSTAYGKIPDGSTIIQINGRPVSNWFELRKIIADSKADDELTIAYLPADPSGGPETVRVHITAQDIETARTTNVSYNLALRALPGTLKTSNPFIAIEWGALKRGT